MSEDPIQTDETPLFDEEAWHQLPDYLAHLPEPVHLHVWGMADASPGERETMRLAQTLADTFPPIHYRRFTRRTNYPYYPVTGIMGDDDGKPVDYNLRIIGQPAGYQMTSLIAAMQAVAFQGTTLEAATRIKLHNLPDEVTIELITSAEDEAGTLMAKIAFGLAAVSDKVKTFLIMGDVFPEIVVRYSVRYLPHMVINGRVHLEGVTDENTVLDHIRIALNA